MNRKGGITGYHQGRVRTTNGSFHVGRLPVTWKGPERSLNHLLYKNPSLEATLVVDALCGRKFDDAPLPILARNLFRGLDHAEHGKAKHFLLDGRAALQLDGRGSIDGVPLRMRVVVMKKDFCLYDLMYLAPPRYFDAGLADFMRYVYDLRVP